jgi:DNA-3-methyladenine glycosylase
MILLPEFYAQDTISVARKLLGCYLVHLEEERTTLGKIVETEAYLADDPASHSFRGETKRSSVMFGPAGYAYVYFIYGMHVCLNVVTGEVGRGEAVLFRALEPVDGLAVMHDRRGTHRVDLLCSGPARLTEALGISLELNGCPLFEGPVQLWSADSFPSPPPAPIVQTTRIGISKAIDLPHRFYLQNNPHVSRR